jgi:CheY-like chemotaxis protein
MQSFKILMADDDLEDQGIIKDTLALLQADDKICFTGNGAEAVEVLEDFYAKGSLPCLIVLDLNMPKLNGTQTLEFLKRDHRFKDIPVVIYSTSINPLEKEKCLLLGAFSYITKPLTFSEGIETAKEFLALCNKQKAQ